MHCETSSLHFLGRLSGIYWILQRLILVLAAMCSKNQATSYFLERRVAFDQLPAPALLHAVQGGRLHTQTAYLRCREAFSDEDAVFDGGNVQRFFEHVFELQSD